MIYHSQTPENRFFPYRRWDGPTSLGLSQLLQGFITGFLFAVCCLLFSPRDWYRNARSSVLATPNFFKAQGLVFILSNDLGLLDPARMLSICPPSRQSPVVSGFSLRVAWQARSGCKVRVGCGRYVIILNPQVWANVHDLCVDFFFPFFQNGPERKQTSRES